MNERVTQIGRVASTYQGEEKRAHEGHDSRVRRHFRQQRYHGNNQQNHQPSG